MIGIAKRVITGTRWEEPVKRLHAGLTRHKNSLYDWQTIAIMRRVLRSDSTGIDIGAFEGGMLRHILRMAPQGKHWAFEPLPDQHKRLKQRFPSVEIYPCALGAEAGIAPYHHMLDRPALSGLQRRYADLQSESTRAIEVRMETLDRIIPQDATVAFVKIDVEGGELGVFQGGILTLRRTRPVVVFECGLGGADHFGAEPGQIFDLLTETIGLRISLLGDWLGGRPPLRRRAFVDEYERRSNFYFVAAP